MNKLELSSRVAGATSLSRTEPDSVVSAVFSAMTDTLAKGEPVTNAGFGAFTIRSREARSGRNPRTGESITIAASKAPSFKAGKILCDAVNWRPGRRSMPPSDTLRGRIDRLREGRLHFVSAPTTETRVHAPEIERQRFQSASDNVRYCSQANDSRIDGD